MRHFTAGGGRERTVTAAIFRRSGLHGAALRFTTRHAAPAHRTVVFARRIERAESTAVLSRTRLTCPALRLRVCIPVERPIPAAVFAWARRVSVSEAAHRPIANTGTRALHGSNGIRAAPKRDVRAAAGRNRAHTILLQGLPQARGLLLKRRRPRDVVVRSEESLRTAIAH